MNAISRATSDIISWFMTNSSIIFSTIRVVLDVLIVWFVIFYLLEILRRNVRTMQLIKGILFVLIIKLLSSILNLSIISWLVDLILSWGVVAIIIIFQPEIRSMLEKLGQTHVTMNVFSLSTTQKEKLVNEMYEACRQMSEEHTGAIITFEREQSLEDYIGSGVDINADVNADLLLTIFKEGTRLHDGAVIVQANRIRCASAFFPSTKQELSPKYGARHRAALGISEVTDALTIVVSEETGTISFANKGELTPITIDVFKSRLLEELDGFVNEDKGV